MPPSKDLTQAQIGKAGELFVQMQLLLLGIESAPMSTDTGIDLVAYSPAKKVPLTIQVKTNLRPKKAGGKGKLHLDWWIPDNSPAVLQALVDLSTPQCWLFTNAELKSVAQQHSGGKFHIYMYTDLEHKPRNKTRKAFMHEFESFTLSNRSSAAFGAKPHRGVT
jgi:hypothetical protein